MIEKLRGKRTSDIRLPMPANGRRDPRLGKPSPGAKLIEGVDRARDMVRKAKRPTKRAAARR